MLPSLRVEELLWRRGLRRVAGIDEAGRGAWAGPVVAAAVVLPNRHDLLAFLASALGAAEAVESGASPEARRAQRPRRRLTALRDSKELSPAQRVRADRVIREAAAGVGIGVVSARIIDEFGLGFAGQLAFWRAVRALPQPPQYLLVDGFPLWSPSYPQLAVVDGDARSTSIAAASIVAKVLRDRIMGELAEDEPRYGFRHNVGYGTAEHRSALGTLGPSVHHRRSFQPVTEALLRRE